MVQPSILWVILVSNKKLGTMHKRHQVQGLFLSSSAPWATGRSCCFPLHQADHISLPWSGSSVSYRGRTSDLAPPASEHTCSSSLPLQSLTSAGVCPQVWFADGSSAAECTTTAKRDIGVRAGSVLAWGKQHNVRQVPPASSALTPTCARAYRNDGKAGILP